jgi:hypothetical protein
MKKNKLLAIALSVFLSNAVVAEYVDDPDQYQIETIPMKFQAGKDLGDLMSLSDRFASFAKAGQLKFSSRILVPWAVSNAALPDNQDWDALWVGIAPNTKEYANALSYYLKNGDVFNSDFDAVRTNVGTTLMSGEAVFRGELAASGETGVVLFRTCQLKAKQTMDSAEKAMAAMSEKLKAGGSKGGTYFWNPGPGTAPSMEDSFLVTRWFPSLEAWGDSAMAYQTGDMTKVEAGVGRVMDCSAFRMYLDYPFYMAEG